jgi:hypothetical protein
MGGSSSSLNDAAGGWAAVEDDIEAEDGPLGLWPIETLWAPPCGAAVRCGAAVFSWNVKIPALSSISLQIDKQGGQGENECAGREGGTRGTHRRMSGCLMGDRHRSLS